MLDENESPLKLIHVYFKSSSVAHPENDTEGKTGKPLLPFFSVHPY